MWGHEKLALKELQDLKLFGEFGIETNRLVFSPQTHKLCSQEILKVTGNLKEYEQIFKSNG